MEGRERKCKNKVCEVYNQSQGDNGYEESKNWPCVICGKKLTK